MRVVTAQELRDLWLGGRGLVLTFAFSLLLSVVAYLVATNRGLNFLEHRETVNLVLQVAIAVGALLSLLAAADTVSGERERGTLESLLLTPVSRLGLTTGKLLGALSLWVVAFLVAIPYVWFLGRGVGLVGDALLTGAVVGTLLAVFLASFGVLISIFARSNRVSLSLSLLLLLALFVPTQLPSNAQQGWAGDLLLRANPITAGEHYVGTIVTNRHARGARRCRPGPGGHLRHERPDRDHDEARAQVHVPVTNRESRCDRRSRPGRTPERGRPDRPHVRRPRGLVVAPDALPGADLAGRLDHGDLADECGQRGHDRALCRGPAAQWDAGQAGDEPDPAASDPRPQDAQLGRDPAARTRNPRRDRAARGRRAVVAPSLQVMNADSFDAR